MNVTYSAVSRLFRRLPAGASVLAISLLSIHCGDGGPALETINRKSFAPCSEIPHSASPAKYLATASTGGAYALLGDAIAKVAKGSPGTELKVCTTVGSSENLKLLQQRKVQFALVQLDTLHYAIEAAEDGGPALEDISLVTFLYSEKLHLFVKPHLYLNSLADLNHGGGGNAISRRARVWLGQNGSGARQTASKVLQAAGVADEDLMKFGSSLNDLSWDVAANCLLAEGNTGLAAYFRTMAVPGHAQPSVEPRKRPACPLIEPSAKPVPLSVDDLLRADAQIMPLPRELIDRLTEDGLYVRTTIEFGNYGHLRRGVPTVGIPTVLLTNLPSSHRSAVKALIDRVQLDPRRSHRPAPACRSGVRGLEDASDHPRDSRVMRGQEPFCGPADPGRDPAGPESAGSLERRPGRTADADRVAVRSGQCFSEQYQQTAPRVFGLICRPANPARTLLRFHSRVVAPQSRSRIVAGPTRSSAWKNTAPATRS